MARPRTNAASNVATAEESSVATDIVADENVDVETEDAAVVEDTATKKVASEKPSAKKEKVAELSNDDEIEVVSLIPNVSYKDSHTYDIYTWEEVGHVEFMTFETLTNMWRNSKGYFKNMWLKPEDDRVIKKFGLTGMYEKYDFLMDKSNYTRDNIDKICESIASTPNGLKLAVCNKIKSLVVSGELSDISVIRSIEKYLKIDLIALVG